jgi:NitT/TauT family transport system permease protein
MTEQSTTIILSEVPSRKAASRPLSIAARLRGQTDRIGMLVLVIAVLGLWEMLVVVLKVSPLVMAKPSDIASALWIGFAEGLYWTHLATTLTEMISGFLFGSVLGLVCGLAITEFGRFGRLLFPYLVAIQSIPKVATAPLIIMWLGFGLQSKIVLVTLITFFPVLINTISGLSVVDRMRIDLMAVLLANRWQTFLFVRLPSAANQIFAGLSVAVVLALTGSVVAEFVGAQRGLGVLLLQAQANLDTAAMFAILVLLAIIGLTATMAVRGLERKLLYWSERRNEGESK